MPLSSREVASAFWPHPRISGPFQGMNLAFFFLVLVLVPFLCLTHISAAILCLASLRLASRSSALCLASLALALSTFSRLSFLRADFGFLMFKLNNVTFVINGNVIPFNLAYSRSVARKLLGLLAGKLTDRAILVPMPCAAAALT